MNEERENSGRAAHEPARVPKLCGGDIELGNFVLGAAGRGATGQDAARALLREIEGLPRTQRGFASSYNQRSNYRSPGYGYDAAADGWDGYSHGKGGGAYGSGGYGYGGGYWYGYDPQDWGRKFLPANGGCAYIDLEHLELCLPEVTGAHDWVAAWHAMLRIARDALFAANDRLPPGRRINILVNNSDGQGNAWGSHLNFLVTRRCWDNIFHRKLHHMLYLASYQASSIVFTGQGKVGAENGAPEVEFQLSQRADFFETLTGSQTTANRPVVNSRDEGLCGKRPDLARIHCIFYDSNLCHIANLLKVGVMQMVLAMIEAERIDPTLILDDPVGAVAQWSHDPALKARARTASGEKVTAVELQLRFMEQADRFAGACGFDEVVPRWPEIMALWEDTLVKLQRPDRVALLAPRLDWALKLSILESVLGGNGFDWRSPEIKHLDHMYANLDSDDGIYWAYERNGFTEQVASEARIEALRQEPPVNTRAWTRAMLLRAAGPEGVDGADWDAVRIKQKEAAYLTTYRKIELADPLGYGKSETAHLFDGRNLADVLDELEQEHETDAPTQRQSGGGGPSAGSGSPARDREPPRAESRGGGPSAGSGSPAEDREPPRAESRGGIRALPANTAVVEAGGAACPEPAERESPSTGLSEHAAHCVLDAVEGGNDGREIL